MAASIGNGRQPDNSEGGHQEQRLRLRRRPQQNLQKQLSGQEVKPIPPPPPNRSRRSARLSRYQPIPMSTNSSFEPPKPPPVRQNRRKSVLTGRSAVQPLRPIPEIPQRRLSSPTYGATPPHPSDSQPQVSGYRREDKTSPSNSPSNPWQVKPPQPTAPVPPSSRASRQNPQPMDAGRGSNGSKGREASERPTFQLFNFLKHSSQRRRANRSSRMATNGVAPIQGEKAAGRRASVKATSQTTPIPTKRIVRRPQKRSKNPFVYIIRLLILGIGIGAIAGTLLSALDPASQASVKVNEPAKSQVQESPKPANRPAPLALSQEISPLKAQLQTLVGTNSKLQPGIFIVDLDTGAYIDLSSQSAFPAASTIKVPIFVALFQDVDAGKIRLDETLTLQGEMIATGSGDLQYKKPGTKYTVLELATKMITISDNTATNMLIARLGGVESLNQRFRSWGLTTTVLRNPLPDLEGTNMTSPQELALLMSSVNQGQLVSLPSRDRMLGIMQQNEINTLLPKGLGEGAIIAHKTGNIGSMLADVGLVAMPTGKRYIISVMVKRPFNDTTAQEFIRQISQTAYDYFYQPRVSPSTTSMPSDTTATQNRAVALDNEDR
ncbi:MAG TPA: serine hydrolase [Waterburya sp.]